VILRGFVWKGRCRQRRVVRLEREETPTSSTRGGRRRSGPEGEFACIKEEGAVFCGPGKGMAQAAKGERGKILELEFLGGERKNRRRLSLLRGNSSFLGRKGS